MTNIEQIVATYAPGARIIDITPLKSKRNNVLLVTLGIKDFPNQEHVIIKCFRTPNLSTEKIGLTNAALAGVSVPRILATGSDYLLLEYIVGPNLCDLFNASLNPIYVRGLGDWLATYHNAVNEDEGSVQLKGDARLRNFIWKNDRIFGLDFEESRYDLFVHDVAEAAGSIFDTTPGINNPLFFPVKIKMINEFVTQYEATSRIPDARELLRAHFVPLLIHYIKTAADRRYFWTRSPAATDLRHFLARLKRGELDPLNL